MNRVYAYCLSDAAAPDWLDGVTGLEESIPWILDVDGLKAVVGTLRSATTSVNRQNVMAHERVIRRVMQEETPLPFRFGTLVAIEDLREFVRRHRAQFTERLDRVRGCVEMNVKILAPEGAALEVALPGAGELEGGPGTAFLARKAKAGVTAPDARALAESLAGWLKSRIAGTFRDAALRLNPTHHMILSAAYLVERPGLATYRDRVAEARLERPDLRFLTSGTWPPYSFSSIEP